jgi:hypothetical protein
VENSTGDLYFKGTVTLYRLNSLQYLSLMIIGRRRLQLAAILKYSLNHHLDRLKDKIKHLKFF